VLTGKGYELTVVSPKGGKAPLDPSSVQNFKEDASSQAFLKKSDLWENTGKLADVKASDYDAIFYPGGHGPMFDLINDETSIKLIEEFYKAGKPVAAVCHGPIVFVNVKVDGKPLLEGREATGFSNSEEEAVQLTDVVPFLVEDELTKLGGLYSKTGDWQPYVLQDGLLITGQNPASSAPAADALIKLVDTRV